MRCRSQWPRGLRRGSSAARLLRLWVRIPPGAWMFVCCECCVLSGRGLCDRFITRPEESYRLWRVVVCDQETSKTRRLKPATGLWKYNQKGCNARKTNKHSRWDNCSSPSIIRAIKSKQMRWAGHVTRMRERKRCNRVSVEKPERREWRRETTLKLEA